MRCDAGCTSTPAARNADGGGGTTPASPCGDSRPGSRADDRRGDGGNPARSSPTTPKRWTEPMPNQPRKNNPVRTFRAEDELWDPALEAARERGESLSEHVIRPALQRYVKRHEREKRRKMESA